MKKRNLSRTLALALSIIMAFGLMVPAFAANTQTVAVSYDGALQYKNGYADGTKVTLPLFTTGDRDVEKVTVTSGEYTKEITDFGTATKDTLPSGTVYTLTATKDADEATILTLSTTGIKDGMNIAITTKETNYEVMANSGTYGQNSNYGNISSATCDASKNSLSVAGGAGYAVEFTPHEGLEISHLNIRANYSNRTKLVGVNEGTVTVAGQTFTVTKLDNGVVRVSCTAAKHDMFITALTVNAAKKYTLTVSSDAQLTPNVGSVILTAGTSKDVTFTPVSGCFVETVTITDGTATGTISATADSVRVNGHTYVLDRKPDGSAVLSVPGMAADVTVAASSGIGRTYLEVKGKGFTSNFSGLTYVADNSSNTVVIRPNDGIIIEDITVNSANGVASFAPDEEYFVLGGTLYRIGHDSNDRILIYLNPMPGNTSITVRTKDTYHTITLDADSGAYVVGKDTLSVKDGTSKDVSFKPVNGYEITRVTVTVDGDSYSADTTRDYVSVKGTRYRISVDSTGRVTVTVPAVDHNVKVAVSTKDTKADNLISKNHSSHATVVVNPGMVYKNDDVTITVKPAMGYDLTSVVLTSEGRSITVRPKTTSISLNGMTFKVNAKANGSMVLTCSKVIKAVSVAVNTTRNSDDIKNYHPVYMYGIGNGLFAPEANMTRAEAVTMLTRLFSGLDEDELADYDDDSRFYDVASNAWYAPYIVWAEDEGLLSGLYGSARYFRPTDAITRAEFVDLICRFNGGYEDEGYNLKYTDMTWNHWAARQIAYATGNGWITGYPNGTFGPDDTITRCQVTAVINRVMDRTDTDFIHTIVNPVFFTDVPATHWAYHYILEATNAHYCGR